MLGGGDGTHSAHAPAGSEVSTWRPRDQNLPGAPRYHVGLGRPSLTLKLRPDFPGAGGKAPKHVAITVLEQHQAGPPVCDVPAELGEAVPVELGREEEAPAKPPLLGQV